MIKVNDRGMFLNEVNRLLPISPVAVEVGVFNGDFSQEILNRLKPCDLALIDPFKEGNKFYPGDGNQLTAYSNSNNFRIVWEKFRGDRRVYIDRRYSYEAVFSYLNNTFDFIYHDASHLYEDLKKDLFDWLRVLKPSGLMCGHDYTGNYSDHVIKAV